MDPKELLIDLMDTDFDLLDELLSCETLTRREMNEVKQVRNRYDRNKLLLEYIDRKGNYEQFKAALAETRQKHLANYLDSNGVYSVEFEDDWPLTTSALKVLDVNQHILVDMVDPDELTNFLTSKKVISYRQQKVIHSKPNEFEKNELLIEIFRRCSRHHYQRVVECLRLSNQGHVADILQLGGVVVQVHTELDEDEQSETKIAKSIQSLLYSKKPQEQRRIFELVQLQDGDMQLIDVRPSNSIGLYFHCRTPKGLNNLYELVTSGRLKQIVDIVVRKLLQPSQKLTTVLEIRLEESQHQRCKKYFDDISAGTKESSETLDSEENAAASRHLRDVAGLTVCSICSSSFSKPRSLPCFHRFCLKCLEEEYAHNKKPGNKISCPICARLVKVPVDGVSSLPRNLFLDRLLKASGAVEYAKVCDVCMENEIENEEFATKRCAECEQNMCENCFKEHRRHRPSKNHTGIELRSSENMRCKAHPESVAVKYCSASESFICAECTCFEGKREQHKHIDVKQVIEESRRIIETVKGEVSDLLEETNGYDLQKLLLESISKTESYIVARCEEIKKTMESHKLELLQKLDLIKSKRLKEIKEEQNAIESHRNDLGWFLNIVEELQEKGSPYELTDAKIGISAEAAVLQNHQRSLRKKVEEEGSNCYVEFIPVINEDLLYGQNCIGTIKVSSNVRKTRDSSDVYYYTPQCASLTVEEEEEEEEEEASLCTLSSKRLIRGKSVVAISETENRFTTVGSKNLESQQQEMLSALSPEAEPRKIAAAPASMNSQLTETRGCRYPASYNVERTTIDIYAGEEEIYDDIDPQRLYDDLLSAYTPTNSVRSTEKQGSDGEVEELDDYQDTEHESHPKLPPPPLSTSKKLISEGVVEDMDFDIPEDAPRPRLCHLRKRPDFNGFGFNLHDEKGKSVQFIGKVDEKSPAHHAGLRKGDLIIEVNGTNVRRENHQQVVQRIKAVPDEIKFLVLDREADDYYRERKIVVRGDLRNVLVLKTPLFHEAGAKGTGKECVERERQDNVQQEEDLYPPFDAPPLPPKRSDASYLKPNSKSELTGVREFMSGSIRIQHIFKSGSCNYTEICLGTVDNLVDVLVKRYSEEAMAEPAIKKWCEFYREAEVLSHLQHPNIVKLLGISTTEPNYVVCQFTAGTFLSSFLKKDNGTKIKLKEAINITTQIADALGYLEEKKCIHRQLSAKNFIIGDNLVVKVTNFEMAIFLDKTGKHGTFSDPYEMLESPLKTQAPEVIQSKRWSAKSDVWSFGIVLYEIMTHGAEAYPGMTNERLASAVRTTYTLPLPCGDYECSEKRLDTIMHCCWNKSPDRRPTFEYLFKFFRDYFAQGGKENSTRFLPRPDLLRSIEGIGPVRGITLLNNRFYVVRSNSRNIEVYDSSKLKRKSKTISVDGETSKIYVLKEKLSIPHGGKSHQSGLKDVASCPNLKCIYVSDSRDSRVHRFHVEKRELLPSWPVQEPFGLSITKYGNVMVSCRNSAKLYEYTPSGELAHVIDIGGNGEGPVHGIQIGEDFVVCHGDSDVGHCREFVCIYDVYNQKPDHTQRVELMKPSYLAVDSSDQVLVAETGRDRIVLLSHSLDSLTVLLTSDHKVIEPTRICLDERSGRLFVGLENGSLLVFQVKLHGGRPIQHSVSSYFETDGFYDYNNDSDSDYATFD